MVVGVWVEYAAGEGLRFVFTDVLSGDGDLKCLVYFRFLDSLNGKPSSQGPYKIVPRETDTIAFPLKK